MTWTLLLGVVTMHVCMAAGQCSTECNDGKPCVESDCQVDEFVANITAACIASEHAECYNTWNVDFMKRPHFYAEKRDHCWTDCNFGIRQCKCCYDIMDCEDKRITTMATPPDARYKVLMLAYNRLGENLTDLTFSGYDHVTHLYLINNHIRDLPHRTFKPLTQLLELHLGTNLISSLQEGQFDHQENLKVLYLSVNSIDTLQSAIFYPLLNLEELYLGNNKITVITNGLFQQQTHLRILCLEHNMLSALRYETFSRLTNLEYLSLEGNKIQDLDQHVFGNHPNLDIWYDKDNHPLCCMVRDDVRSCSSDPEMTSLCDDLLRSDVIRVFTWLLGIAVVLFNLMVIVYQIIHFNNHRVHTFLIINLALSHLPIGVYALILAWQDVHFGTYYVMLSNSWLTSQVCVVAGALATLGSVMSVLIVSVITLDRFMVVVYYYYPSRRIDFKAACLLVAFSWLFGLGLTTLPFSNADYFGNYYGRSSECSAVVPPKFVSNPDYDEPGYGASSYNTIVFLVLNVVSIWTLIAHVWMGCSTRNARVVSKQAGLDRSLAVEMLLVVVPAVICWLPISVLGFTTLFGAPVPAQVHTYVVVVSLSLHAAINPTLYTLVITLRVKRRIECAIEWIRTNM